jgi:hypothetical protein
MIVNSLRGLVKSAGGRLPACSPQGFEARVEASIPPMLAEAAPTSEPDRRAQRQHSADGSGHRATGQPLCGDPCSTDRSKHRSTSRVFLIGNRFSRNIFSFDFSKTSAWATIAAYFRPDSRTPLRFMSATFPFHASADYDKSKNAAHIKQN